MAKEIGKVFTYYGNLGVAAVKLTGSLKLGEEVLFKGNTTNFKQKITSMQVEHTPVKEAKKGSDVGIKVNEVVRRGDLLLKE